MRNISYSFRLWRCHCSAGYRTKAGKSWCACCHTIVHSYLSLTRHRSSFLERHASCSLEVTLNTCIPESTPHLITTYCHCLQGCLFGPPVSKWIAFLSRLRFATPTKTVIYRVRVHQSQIAITSHRLPTIYRHLWTKHSWHLVRSCPTASIDFFGAQSTW